MAKWLGWWIVCLLGGALILIIGLVAAIFFLAGVFWIMDNWPGTFFLAVYSCFVIAMGIVLHKAADNV